MVRWCVALVPLGCDTQYADVPACSRLYSRTGYADDCVLFRVPLAPVAAKLRGRAAIFLPLCVRKVSLYAVRVR